MLMLDIAIFGALVKMLVEWENPLPPAVIYAGYKTCIAILGGEDLVSSVALACVAFVFLFAFYRILVRLERVKLRW